MYNNSVYNFQQYNANTFLSGLSETLTGSDSLGTIADFNRLLSEAQPLADNLLRFFNQVDEMALDYFSPTDVATVEFNKSLVDSAGLTDSTVVVNFIKALLETMSPADTVNFLMTTTKNEAVILADSITKSITDKGLPETVTLKDWVILKRTTGSEWYD